MAQYIYLLQTRECIAIKQNIYKLGKTTQPILGRFNQYPKGSKLIHHTLCINCDLLERKLIKEFKTMFKQCKNYGTEYFEGSWIYMRYMINKAIDDELRETEHGAEKGCIVPYIPALAPVQYSAEKGCIVPYVPAPVPAPVPVKDIKYVSNLSPIDAIINDCFKNL
jgi:hypothetical protein